MAFVMKCDRCGRHYESCDAVIDGVTLQSYSMGKCKRRAEGEFDLCPDCVKSFDDWLMKRMRAEKGGKR